MADKALQDPEFSVHDITGVSGVTNLWNASIDPSSLVVPTQHSDQVISGTRKWWTIMDFRDEPLDLDPHREYMMRVRTPAGWTAGQLEFSTGGAGTDVNGDGRFWSQIVGGTLSPVNNRILIQTVTKAKTHMVGENVGGGNLRKELLYQAQDQMTVPEMTVLQLGLLTSIGRTTRKFGNIVTSIPIDVPPLGKQVRFIDQFNHIDTYLDIMGYTISGNVLDENNLSPVSMEWALESRL